MDTGVWKPDLSKAILLGGTILEINGRSANIPFDNMPKVGASFNNTGGVVEFTDKVILVLPAGVEGPHQNISWQQL